MARILIDRNVSVPMRDGVVLAADVYRPDVGGPWPVILSRLPYNKDDLAMHMEAIHPVRAVEAGYAVVLQDTRGRYQSGGDFYPFVHEAADGYDTVEWVGAQPWCSGSVGMVGASYFGATQWLAATQQPPHLKAIFPMVTSSEYYEGWTYQGGAFQLGFALLWVLTGFAPDTASRLAKAGVTDADEALRLAAAVDDIDRLYRHQPLASLPLLRDSQAARYYFDWLAHAANDAYWQQIAINRQYDRILAPAYNVGGWYDIFLKGTLENYTRMRVEGGSEAARSGQRLLLAPWAHGKLHGDYADLSFGIDTAFDLVDAHGRALRFFDRYLKGIDNGLEQEPPVRLYVMGENRWRDEWEWPLARTQYIPWFLHSDGAANTSGGTLSPVMPDSEPIDLYLFDPRQPAPTVGGPAFLPGLRLAANAGPRDQREVEARADVLTYTSTPMTEPLEVTGLVSFELWATSTAVDTDWVVKLCDVAPDGASRILCEGILRARFRAGFETPSPITPGKVYHYTVDLVATSHVFLPGHSLRVDVTSSSWPRFDINPNTGRPLGVDGPADVRPALQAVLHTNNYPSHIVLPVIPH